MEDQMRNEIKYPKRCPPVRGDLFGRSLATRLITRGIQENTVNTEGSASDCLPLRRPRDREKS
jgi:hypothetical protein